MKTRKRSLNSTEILIRLGAGEEIRTFGSKMASGDWAGLSRQWMQKPNTQGRAKDAPNILFMSFLSLKRKGLIEEFEPIPAAISGWVRRWGLKKA